MRTKVKTALISAGAVIIAAFISKSKTQESSNIVTNEKHKTNIDVSDSNIEIGDQSPVILGDNNIINYNNIDDSTNIKNQGDEEEIYSSSVSENAEEDNNSNNIGTPYVITSPNNTITKAYLYKWDKENDRDIIGNTYPTAIKLSVYNMIYAMGGGADNITAEIHFPIGNKLDGIILMNFVVASEMVGNGSSAQITILADENEVYPTFTLNSTSTDELSYEIDLNGIRDLVIRFDCYAVDSGFCAGIVLEDK